MNRKPTDLKLLHGNPGKRQLDDEPKPKKMIPERPKDMDEGAVKIWKKLAPKLSQLGLLTEVDGDSLRNLCQIRSRLEKIYNGIAANGGELISTEYTKLEKQYLQLYRLYAADFGLSPRGRTGLSVGGEKKTSEFENLLD